MKDEAKCETRRSTFGLQVFLSQCPTADLAALVGCNLAHNPDVPRNLPLTQVRPAETQHAFAIDPLPHDAGHGFLTTQRRGHAKDHGLAHAWTLSQTLLHIRGIQLATGDIDHVRSASDDCHPTVSLRNKIVRHETSLTQRGAAHLDAPVLPRNNLHACKRGADEAFNVLRFATGIVANAAAFRGAVE